MVTNDGRVPDIGEVPWPGVLDQECSKPYFNDLMGSRMGGRAVYPPPSDVFAVFHTTPFDAVRVVIVGQDPYPNRGQAMGLAFSVRPDPVRVLDSGVNTGQPGAVQLSAGGSFDDQGVGLEHAVVPANPPRPC